MAVQPVPTPKVPLLRGTHVAQEWLRYFQSLKDETTDISDALKLFKTIAVAGEDDIVAESEQDTLTVETGTTDLLITTDSINDKITFDLLVELLDPDAVEVISGAWEFTGAPWIAQYPSVTYTGIDAALTTDELGKVVKMVNGSTNVTCTLPTVTISDVDKWVTIIRRGTAELIIQAKAGDVIETSDPGGYVFCDEINRVAANLKLYLADSNTWAILGGTGIWKVV